MVWRLTYDSRSLWDSVFKYIESKCILPCKCVTFHLSLQLCPPSKSKLESLSSCYWGQPYNHMWLRKWIDYCASRRLSWLSSSSIWIQSVIYRVTIYLLVCSLWDFSLSWTFQSFATGYQSPNQIFKLKCLCSLVITSYGSYNLSFPFFYNNLWAQEGVLAIDIHLRPSIMQFFSVCLPMWGL